MNPKHQPRKLTWVLHLFLFFYYRVRKDEHFSCVNFTHQYFLRKSRVRENNSISRGPCTAVRGQVKGRQKPELARRGKQQNRNSSMDRTHQLNKGNNHWKSGPRGFQGNLLWNILGKTPRMSPLGKPLVEIYILLEQRTMMKEAVRFICAIKSYTY